MLAGGGWSLARSSTARYELTEQLRRHIGEVIAPVAPHVAFFGRREDVLDLGLIERIVETLRTGEDRIGLAAGDVEELQLLVGGSGIGEEILICVLRISAPAGAERAQRVKRVEMGEADLERLPATHRKPRECAVIGFGGDAIELLDIR